MEKRFMPDLAVRLSADSVEKYRDEIDELLRSARRKRKEFKTAVEKELRRSAPELLEQREQSLYLKILNSIESRMHNASMIMLPALRQALQGFTRRADIIMRQLSYSGGGVQNRLHALCDRLKLAPQEQQTAGLHAAGEALASLSIGFVDTDSLRLNATRQARVVNTSVEVASSDDKESRKQMYVQTAVDLAFTFNNQAQRDYVVQALSDGHRIHSQNLPVADARELLMSAHIIELGAPSSSEFEFRVLPTANRVRTDYFEVVDEFTIELIERGMHAQ